MSGARVASIDSGDQVGLFDTARAAPGGAVEAGLPLAERLRPRSLDEVVGQDHLLGPGRPLRVAAQTGRLHSMLLWGPPGVGKTTLARLLCASCGAGLTVLSAVMAGVKDIRELVERAQRLRAQGQTSVVFVDEVHRFNKAQQDAFLPHVESGLLTFIGATTENPSFEVNAALLSRATVHVLKALDEPALGALLDRALARLGAVPMAAAARSRLLAHADGDARRLLTALDNALGLAAATGGVLDEATLERALGAMLRRHDKGGDAFHDTISALHKSVRSSQPDAALYWLARLLDGGTDPRYVARRLLRIASEDVGLADPRALTMTLEAAQVYERLGSPEGELALAQAVVFLAVAPKSDAVYGAWSAAQKLVREHASLPVPEALRNAPTRLARAQGHGQGYRHAHDEPGAYPAGVNCWPEALMPARLYRPSDRGLEARIAERLAHWRGLDEEANNSR